MNKIYSAVVEGTKLVIFDAQKGTRSYTISLGDVSIVTGPIITHDKLTVVVKDKRGKTMSKIYSLKTGTLSYTFSIHTA